MNHILSEAQQLLTALESGDFQIALPLLPKDGPPITTGPEDFTPLHYACRHGEAEVARLLITQYKYSVKSPSKHGHTPVHVAAQYGHTDTLRALVECSLVSECETKGYSAQPHCTSSVKHISQETGIHVKTSLPAADSPYQLRVTNILTRNQNGETPLHLAAQNGHLEVVKYLVDEEGCPTSPIDGKGRTPLYLAAKKGQLQVVIYFTEVKKCDPSTGTTKRWKHTPPGNTPLHIASRKGHLDVVQYLVNALSCDASCTDQDGRTPLLQAVIKGHLPVVQFLVEKGSDPMVTMINDWTPVHSACLNGHLEVVKYLTNSGQVDLSCQDKEGATPLLLAAQNGHLQVVQFLVKTGCDPMVEMLNGGTPLHFASQNGHLDTVKYLASNDRVDLLCQNDYGVTPLLLAAQSGHLPVVQFLTEIGCDPMIRTVIGWTPLHSASQKGHLNIVKYLICDKGVNPSCQDSNGVSPLFLAAFQGHLPTVQFLVQKGCDPMVKEVRGMTPLHSASQNGHIDTVQYLASDKQIDPSCQDKYSVTPLLLAAQNGHLPVVQFLVSVMGCDPMMREVNGRTPLHFASQNGHLDVVKYLARDDQVDSSCQDQYGVTPLHLASRNGHLSVVSYLLHECDPSQTTSTGQTAISIAHRRGQKDVVSYLHSKGEPLPTGHLQEAGLLCPIVKIYVVGNQASGKTTLVKALSAQGSWLGTIRNVSGVIPETAGIIPSELHDKDFGQVTLYDFAGHPEHYAGHEVVFENVRRPCIVLVTVDLCSEYDTLSRALRFWRLLLSNSFADVKCQAHVIVVGSHGDLIRSQDLPSKSVLLRQFSPSLFLKVVGHATLDCRKPSSKGMSHLRDLLKRSCKMLRRQANFDYKLGRILNLFITAHFSGVPMCTVNELLHQVMESTSPDSEPLKSPDVLYQTCESLNISGHLLLIVNKEDLQESWLIFKKEAVTAETHGLLRHIQSSTQLGIVPLTVLEHLLADHTRLPADMAIRYMKSNLFCSDVDPQALSLITGYQSTSESDKEKYLFFPSLVLVERPAQVWEWSPAEHYTYVCGWHLICTDPDHPTVPPIATVRAGM